MRLQKLCGAHWGASDMGLHARQSPLYQAASAAFSYSANPIYLPGDGAERPLWDCYNPCDHEGELKGKALS